MGSHLLLQGIFLTQGSNPGPLHCRQILYHLSYEGRPIETYEPLIILGSLKIGTVAFKSAISFTDSSISVFTQQYSLLSQNSAKHGLWDVATKM